MSGIDDLRAMGEHGAADHLESAQQASEAAEAARELREQLQGGGQG